MRHVRLLSALAVCAVLLLSGCGSTSVTLKGMTPPTASGLYTFSLGLSVNSEAPVFFSTTKPVLLATVTQEWSGQNCTTDAMMAQIPASSQSYYICPPA